MKYSADQNTWHDELGDVLCELEQDGELAVGAKYYKGAAVVPKLSHLFCVDDFLYRLDEVLFDEYGHLSDALSLWDELDPKAIRSLDVFVKAWLDEHCVLPIFLVESVEECFVTEEDLLK